MTEQTIEASVLTLIGKAQAPMSASDVANALPHFQRDSVRAQVAAMARLGRLKRHSNADGILRYSMPDPGARAEPRPVARCYRPPVTESAVRTLAGADAPAPAATLRNPADQPTATSHLVKPLQARVRATVESDPARRWTLDALVGVLDLQPEGKVRRDEVRARLANLSRNGSVSPVRRMTDGTWMANSPQTREIYEREWREERERRRSKHSSKDNAPPSVSQVEVDTAVALLMDKANDGPAAAAAQPVVDREAVAAGLRAAKTRRRLPDPDRIEGEERKALRQLLAALISHVHDPAPPLARAMEHSMHTLHRGAV